MNVFKLIWCEMYGTLIFRFSTKRFHISWYFGKSSIKIEVNTSWCEEFLLQTTRFDDCGIFVTILLLRKWIRTTLDIQINKIKYNLSFNFHQNHWFFISTSFYFTCICTMLERLREFEDLENETFVDITSLMFLWSPGAKWLHGAIFCQNFKTDY